MMRLAVFLVCVVTACAAVEPNVRLSGEWPAHPTDYGDVVEQWTRTASLRGQYQEVLEVTATLKSPDWWASQASRDADNRGLQGEARAQRMTQAQADAAGPFELELMVTTWDRRENDLDRGKKSTWKVVILDDKGMEIEPLEIVKDKRPAYVIRSQFPAFGDFATAYVARFPREANVLGPGVTRVRVRISSARGGLDLHWNAK